MTQTTPIPQQLWWELQFVWAAYLYYKCDDSHWHDAVYDRHVAKLFACEKDWTGYIKSRLPADYEYGNKLNHLSAFGHCLLWTNEDAYNAQQWRDKCISGQWRGATATPFDLNSPTVYTGLQLKDVTPQEVPVTQEATTEDATPKRKRRTKAEMAAARAAAATALDQIADDAEPAPAPVVEPPKKDLATLVEKYVQVRDRKKAIVDKAKEDAAKFDAVLNKIEAILLASFNELGTDNVKTPHGTAYKSTRSSATVADWDSAFAFIQEREMWSMLERRVNKLAVEEYKAETGELPPGINYRTELTINIRRSS